MRGQRPHGEVLAVQVVVHQGRAEEDPHHALARPRTVGRLAGREVAGRALASLGYGVDPKDPRATSLEDADFARDATYPYGSGGPNALFAFITSAYMHRTGATRADFGRLCVDQRVNALAYGSKVFKKPLTLDEYLAARPIAEPIHLFDCVMPCAGAEAFLVMSEARATAQGKTPDQLARDVEKVLGKYVRDPVVTVIVTNFVGPYSEQIRVIGEAAKPQKVSGSNEGTYESQGQRVQWKPESSGSG